jgi:ribosomal protein L37AE/L43A
MSIRTNKFGTRVNVTKCAVCGDEAAHPQARIENPHSWQCNECGTVFTTEGKVLE